MAKWIRRRTSNPDGPEVCRPLIATVPWGQISGTDGTSSTGAPYSVYHGIPYTLPPVGDRSWAKPVLHRGLGAGRVFNGTFPRK
ncbi:hypothetical protein ACOMHN_016515 [Nucella lapillus]